jgi:holliday junction DNA helicase RuvA
MISRLTGKVLEVADDRALLALGPVVLELLIPSADVPTLRHAIGNEITLHTWLYFEGDGSGGSSEPRLLGFSSSTDKAFFEKFITVKGIGPKKALKALNRPCPEVASAIERKDARLLKSLPGIGTRMAEQIIAELSGKLAPFAGPAIVGTTDSIAATTRSREEEDAVLSLLALGERRADVEAWLDRVRATKPELKTTDQLVRALLLARGSR